MKGQAYFWFGMLIMWAVFVIIMLIERSRIEAVLVAIVGIALFILYKIEKKEEGKNASRRK